MDKKNVFSYRWIVLLSIVPIIISCEMMWLSLAPISSLAEKFYGVDSLSIALFSMSYMIMYIIFALPASWVIDRFGFRASLIIGSLITAIFGLSRAIFSDNFTIVLISQFLIACGQPFIINISTKVPANWFPLTERSTATGILTMAQYIGFAVPMFLAPIIAEKSGIGTTLWVFAIISSISAIICISFIKEHPPVPPPGYVSENEAFHLRSIKTLLRNKPYVLVLIVCFISMGIFNAILTLIEPILLPRGITSVQAGIVGAIFVVSGVVGAVVLPILSDKLHRRTPFFVIPISLLVFLYAGLTFLHSFILVSIVSGLAGFSIMGVAPILFQYGSEEAYPVSEGTSLGLILLMGQISGISFVFLFELLSAATGSILFPMLFILAATALEIPITLKMKETKLMTKE